MLKKLISQWEKVLNAILRAKLKYMKNVLSNEMNSFCNAEDKIFRSKSWECEATDAQKLFLSEKKLLNAILEQSSSTWKCSF